MIRGFGVSFAVVFVAASVAACGTGSAPTPSPTAAPSQAAGGPAAFQVGFPPAGTYSTTKFQPRLTLTLDGGWQVLFPDDEDELALETAGGEEILFLASRVSKVVDPATKKAMKAPDDLVGWLRAHPSLAATAPTKATVASRPATTLDVGPKGTSEVEIFAFVTGNTRIPPDVRIRYVVIPMDGPDLVLTTGGPRERFDAAMARVAPILASMQIADG